MAGANNFKAVAVGGAANVITQAAYEALTTLIANGFVDGVADSAKINKVLRQAAFGTAVLGEIIAANDEDALDDGDLAAFKTKLLDALNAALSVTVPDASATVKGKVELATPAETITGLDGERAVTPAGVKAVIDTLTTWPGVYTGSDANNLTFPVGTQLFVVDTDYATHPRNSAQAIYLDAGANYMYTTASGGSMLAGTWRKRGGYSSDVQYERVS